MARNVAHQEGRVIRHFTTAVFDLVPMAGDFRQEQPKTEAAYYFRPRKTILIRTVADGGESYYFRGDHRATFPRSMARSCGSACERREDPERLARLSVLVVGDICLDRWCSYDPALSEPSRETGIPRFAVVSTESTPGAAGAGRLESGCIGSGTRHRSRRRGRGWSWLLS